MSRPLMQPDPDRADMTFAECLLYTLRRVAVALVLIAAVLLAVHP